ncbi:MAG: hypothetical protein JXR31_07825, partial [Prolixibacteraceae bacterium]|nr:hypothetical protein [Prolixibacteraceae bacterium]
LWKTHREIIAYSESGYDNKTWKLPLSWEDVQKIDVYQIKTDGLLLKSKNINVLKDGCLILSLIPDEGISIVPSGVNPENEEHPTPSGKVTFIGTDTETKGNWQKKYGSEGYVIPGTGENIQDDLKISSINGETQVWEKQTKDIQALKNPVGEDNIASLRSHPLHEIIDIQFNDDKEHELAIYFLDWDRKERWTVIDFIDSKTRKVLHSYNLTDYSQGIYLKYKISGSVQCRISNVYTQRYKKSPDSGFSGIFIGGPVKSE